MNDAPTLFNAIDLTVLAVMLFCLVLGAFSGLIMQVFGLFSIFAAGGACLVVGPFFGQALERWIDNDRMAYLVGYLIAFLVVCVLLRIMATMIRKLAETVGLGSMDRLGGAMLGGLKGWIFCTILLVIAAQHGSDSIRSYLDGSFFGFVMVRASDAAVDWGREHKVAERVQELSREAMEKAKRLAPSSAPDGVSSETDAAARAVAGDAVRTERDSLRDELPSSEE